MAKSYHNLAGLVRDLRNARGDASEGSATATQLIDELCEELDLLPGEGGDDDAGGEDDDEYGSGDAAEEESPPTRQETPRRVGGVGGRGDAPTQHSTRARARAESRGLTPRREPCEAGVPRKVPARTTRAGNGGER